MVKQIKYLFFITIFSFLFNQDLIKTKEFTFFKNYNDNGIDFSEILDLNNTIYKVEVINISSINNKNYKKTIMPKCEVDYALSFDILIRLASKVGQPFRVFMGNKSKPK